MVAFEEDASVVRRSARMLGAAATVVVLGAAVAGSVGFVAVGLWVAWVGLGALAYGWVRSPGATPEAVRVRADVTGLSIDGVTAMPASRIVGGWVEPRLHAPPVVHLRGLRGRYLRLVVRDVNAPSSSPVPVVGYNIYRSTGSSSTYQLLNSSVDTQTTYVDLSVQSGSTYGYIVESVDSSGAESVPSNQATATIP